MNNNHQRFLIVSIATVTNLTLPVSAQAFELSFGIDPTNLFDIELGLTSGGAASFRDSSDYDTPFELDDQGEYFDLIFLEDLNQDQTNETYSLGQYACYSSNGINDLQGTIYDKTAGGGCDFDTAWSLTTLFNNAGLNFNQFTADGLLTLHILFSHPVPTPGYSLLTSLTTYHYITSPQPINTIPAPTIVLPILAGLIITGDRRRSQK